MKYLSESVNQSMLFNQILYFLLDCPKFAEPFNDKASLRNIFIKDKLASGGSSGGDEE